MKNYKVRIYVDVLADNKEDAIVEARNKIYNDVRDEEFVVT